MLRSQLSLRRKGWNLSRWRLRHMPQRSLVVDCPGRVKDATCGCVIYKLQWYVLAFPDLVLEVDLCFTD